MNIDLVQFSIIVVANDHNPSLINPDFLERTGIVDAAWAWKRGTDAISTPAFATLSYDAGVTITVEPRKLQLGSQSCPSAGNK